MSRVRLRVWHHGRSLHYGLPARPAVEQIDPFLRLKSTVLLGSDPEPGEVDDRRDFSAVIDTGSPFSLIERGTWELFERLGLIKLLELTEAAPVLSIAGRRKIPFKLGMMNVAVAERHANRVRALTAKPVVFQLLERDANLPHPPILGLHRGVLDGRWLIRQPIDAANAREDRNDFGPASGQQWWLQDEPPRI